MLAISAQVSDTIPMGDHRPAAEADRILVAQLTGEARHHAKWRPLTEEEEAAALAELRALAAGRADLLAEVAGIFEGTSEGELDEPLARSAAQLCRKAGADPEAIPAWIEEGRRRSANARRPPFSGGCGLPTLEDLTGWTLGKLASYKKPTGLVVLAEHPRNAAGKVLKHELRARYAHAGLA